MMSFNDNNNIDTYLYIYIQELCTIIAIKGSERNDTDSYTFVYIYVICHVPVDTVIGMKSSISKQKVMTSTLNLCLKWKSVD